MLPTRIQAKLRAAADEAAASERNPRKDRNMDTALNHLMTLMQTGYTTIKVSFDSSHREYTYKAPKSCGLAVGDLVVVPARDGFSVVKVTAVDDEPDVDLEAPYALRWIVQRVDMKPYEVQLERDSATIAELKKLKRKKARERAIAEILGDVDVAHLQATLNAAE